MDLLVRWLAPDAGAGAYNDWQLISASTLPLWAQGIVLGLLVIGCIASFLSLRRVAPGRRVLLMGLRLLVALWVAVLVSEPTIELRAVSKVRSRVVIMADSSRSMQLATPEGTRAEVMGAHWQQSRAQVKESNGLVVLEPLLFSERSQPVEKLPEVFPSDGPRTDLSRALGEVSWQTASRNLGAVIIYSDGTDTEGLTPEVARRKAAQIGVPIYTVGLGEASTAPDLAIRRIPIDEFAFKHNTVTIDVGLEQHGLELSKVMVSLKNEGRILQTKECVFEGGKGQVSFDFKPTRIGKQVFEVSVPVQDGEVVKSNNRKSVVLKVIRDRIRVLQVAGRPSWDERFLRELLKRNPNVDLISFFILRSTTDLQKASQDELALIPFPVHELFTEELDTFDVVIYQNFSYRPYRMERYLRNIRDFVHRGGSFLMVGGNFAFEDGWYAGTELSEVLPVRLGGAMPWDEASYRPRLTAQGKRHPITRIGDPGEPPSAVYRRLPKLEGFNSAIGLMPGAQALLEHPSLPGNPPVVAVREVRKGRTMSVSTDSFWFWRFLAVGEGGAGREFDRFWNNSLRWLIRDPELSRVRIKAERSVVLLGDAVGAEIKILGTDYRGLADAMVEAELIRLQGDSKATLPAGQELKTGPDGTAIVRFEKVPPGTYQIVVKARKGRERIGTAKEPVIVEAADVEYQAPFPNPEILRALAEGSGGRYIEVTEDMPEIEVKQAQRVEVDRTRTVSLWDSWPAIIVLALLAGLEWWFRRRSGLI